MLAQYLADVVQRGLEKVADNGGDISIQIGLANQIATLIQNTTGEADCAALSVDQRAVQLLARSPAGPWQNSCRPEPTEEGKGKVILFERAG